MQHGSYKILIIEDSKEYSALLKKYLGESGTVNYYLDELVRSWNTDDLDTRIIKRNALEDFRKKTVQIASVTTPQAGLERVRDEEWDAIIIDYHLPNMNGLTLFHELKKIFDEQNNHKSTSKEPYRILLSSNDDGNLVLDMAKEGVEYYLAKGDSEIHGLLSIMATGYYYEYED